MTSTPAATDSAATLNGSMSSARSAFESSTTGKAPDSHATAR